LSLREAVHVIVEQGLLDDRPLWARDLVFRRVAAGMTQAELARAVGTTRETIAHYESGEVTPRPTRQAELRAALKRVPR
jgi:transcriptional regulator with XRE-family HTH domain